MTFELRPATTADQVLIARALYAAWQWRHPWDESSFQDHLGSESPDSYVDNFGQRTGDAGVIAEDQAGSGRQFVGAAWYRFFTATDHRPGFVAEDVPELVVAVEEHVRGRGVGKRLMRQLIDVAVTREIGGLSLHVSGENAVAAGLYRSLGFETLRGYAGRGAVMVKQLPGRRTEPFRIQPNV